MADNELKLREEEIEALVFSAQKGDHDAFTRIYDIFVDPIYRYVYFRVKNGDAEDIVESVFIKVWEHLNKYEKRKNTSFSAWIFRIAHNMVVDNYRASKGETLELDPQLPDTTRVHNPIKNTQHSLDKDVLKRAIGELKKGYREIILHKFINELSNPEISKIMKKSEGSLRILQYRALKSLKKVLEEMGIQY